MTVQQEIDSLLTLLDRATTHSEGVLDAVTWRELRVQGAKLYTSSTPFAPYSEGAQEQQR